MPALVYSYPNFTPNTVIRSTQVNAKFTDIATLLNTTKLNDDNLQNAGITRATKLKTGQANYVLINDGTGAMSEEAILSLSRGGLGFAPSLSISDANKIIAVNSSGTGLVVATTPEAPGSRIYNFSRFF